MQVIGSNIGSSKSCVPSADLFKIAISVADLSANPIIGTPLVVSFLPSYTSGILRLIQDIATHSHSNQLFLSSVNPYHYYLSSHCFPCCGDHTMSKL